MSFPFIDLLVSYRHSFLQRAKVHTPAHDRLTSSQAILPLLSLVSYIKPSAQPVSSVLQLC